MTEVNSRRRPSQEEDRNGKSSYEIFQSCDATNMDSSASSGSTPVAVPSYCPVATEDSNDEDDFIVIQSQEALLRERLEKLTIANDSLELSKRVLDDTVKSLQNELAQQKAEKARIEQQLMIGKENSDKKDLEIEDLNSKKAELSHQNEALKKELTEAKTIVEVKEAFVSHLEMKLAAVNSELSSKKAEVDCLQTRLEESNEMIARLGSEKRDMDVKINESSSQLEMHKALLSSNQEIIEKYATEANEDTAKINELKNQLTLVTTQLEENKSVLAKVASERRDFDSENKILRCELEDLKAKCTTSDSNKELMMKEILELEKLKLKFKVELKTRDERTAELEKEVKQRDERYELFEKDVNDWKAKVENLRKENDELKLRLNQGKVEYEQLFKNYSKIESKLDRLQTKVKTYYSTKHQTGATGEIAAAVEAAQTEVKKLIESELEVPPEDSIVSIITLPCSICKEDITCTSRDLKPMTQHLEEVHKQKVCPVCSMLYDGNVEGADNYFAYHVESHFAPHCPSAPPAMYP